MCVVSVSVIVKLSGLRSRVSRWALIIHTFPCSSIIIIITTLFEANHACSEQRMSLSRVVCRLVFRPDRNYTAECVLSIPCNPSIHLVTRRGVRIISKLLSSATRCQRVLDCLTTKALHLIIPKLYDATTSSLLSLFRSR